MTLQLQLYTRDIVRKLHLKRRQKVGVVEVDKRTLKQKQETFQEMVERHVSVW